MGRFAARRRPRSSAKLRNPIAPSASLKKNLDTLSVDNIPMAQCVPYC